MEVTLLDKLGSDLTVVNSARVSFAKQSEFVFKDIPNDGLDGFPVVLDKEGNPSKLTKRDLSDKDIQLINYLADHKHLLPFRHPQLSFRIAAPIFVARQLGKHQVGMSWSEESRRYITEDVEYYVPQWRKAAPNKKQGSIEESPAELDKIDDMYATLMETSTKVYNALLSSDVAPELARIILPQSMYTHWIWTGSLLSFSHVCKQRLEESSQQEVKIIAEKINAECKLAFPHSWNALMKEA